MLISSFAFCQKMDSLRDKKLLRKVADWEKTFVAKSNDTLTRRFTYLFKPDVGTIAYDANEVNGRQNGLTIGYHRNGKVFSIVYFLDGKPWESIFLADSSGNLHFAGNLKDGYGEMRFINEDGSELGYVNYKNGRLNGKYYFLHEAHGKIALEGELTYNEQLAKYDTLRFIEFLYKKDTQTAVILNGRANDSISQMALSIKSNPNIKIIKTETAIELLPGMENPDLHIYLETGVVPVGHWKLFDKNLKTTFLSYEFDQKGKLTLYISYNEDGSINQKRTYP